MIADIFEDHPDMFRKFVSTTTRAMRDGEIHGEDYYFVDDNTYAKWLAEGKFMLSVEFAGTSYGTLISEVTESDKPLVMLVVESVAREMQERVGARILGISVTEDEAYRRMVDVRGDMPFDAMKRIEADRPRRAQMEDCAELIIESTDRETTKREVFEWMFEVMAMHNVPTL